MTRQGSTLIVVTTLRRQLVERGAECAAWLNLRLVRADHAGGRWDGIPHSAKAYSLIPPEYSLSRSMATAPSPDPSRLLFPTMSLSSGDPAEQPSSVRQVCLCSTERESLQFFRWHERRAPESGLGLRRLGLAPLSKDQSSSSSVVFNVANTPASVRSKTFWRRPRTTK